MNILLLFPVPLHIITKKLESPHIKKYLKNTTWLFGDIILRQGITIFVGIYLARYLMPVGLGTLTIASTYLQLLMPFAQLGLNNLVVRDLVKNQEDEGAILGTSFVMKLIASLFTFVIILVICLYSNQNPELNYLIILYSLVVFFTPFQIIDFYFQAKVKSKYIVYAQQISSIASATLRLYGIFAKLEISWFISCFIIEGIITTVFFLFFYKFKREHISKWQFKYVLFKRLLKELLPVILTGFFIALYMRIDQVMIFDMIGSEKLGIYSAAVKLCEPFYLIATVLVASLFPAIINGLSIGREEYMKRAQNLFNLLTLIAIAGSVTISFFAPYIIAMIYGADYEGAERVLQIYFWASVFVFQGVVGNQCLIAENKHKYATFYTLIGAAINISLNYFLIPIFGINGSAFATLVSYLMSATLLNALIPSTRPLFMLQLKAFIYIFQPWKIIRLR